MGIGTLNINFLNESRFILGVLGLALRAFKKSISFSINLLSMGKGARKLKSLSLMSCNSLGVGQR